MRENAGTPLMTPPGSWAVLGAIFALLLGLGLLLTSDRTPESRSTDSSLPATQISEDHLDDGPGGAIYRVLKLKQRFTIDERLAVSPAEAPKAAPSQPTVALMVLDTVRFDHTSLCGYDRPTTPVLESLVERGASFTCRAYVPGDWTFPTHASYFTGVSVTEHGAHYAHLDHRKKERARSLLVHPLNDGVSTLAETMQVRGYQTVLVSDNGLLAEAGLQRGFEIVTVRPPHHDPRVDWVPPTLARVLAEDVDPARPLFLVLNFVQAHDPWTEPVEELPWSRPPRLPLPPKRFAQDFHGVLHGRISSDEAVDVRQQLEDVYDFGVYREDRALGRSLRMLEEAGWLEQGHRIVIASDHGELLFEHGLWRHLFVYEENTRIPLVYWSSEGHLELPEPFPAIALHHLLLEGSLPESLPRPHTVSIPNPESRFADPKHNRLAASLWNGEEKLVWQNGEYYLIDLSSDAAEQSPQPLGHHPLRPELEAIVAKMQETGSRSEESVDEALVERLKALGYLQ